MIGFRCETVINHLVSDPFSEFLLIQNGRVLKTMNKISTKSYQLAPVSDLLRASKDSSCNDIVLIKDDSALLMMNVIRFLDNTNISESESEL